MEYGLIGKTLKHSYSKLIHSYIGKYKYELKEIDESDLESFILNKEYKAINVTIPYKESVIKYLDKLDESALSIGAVNLVVNKNNELIGYNTDYYGLLNLIKRNHIKINNKKVLILGTGGTSKTAYAVVKNLNAKEIVFVSSSNKEGAISYYEVKEKCADFDIIINTTPVGMYPNNDLILELHDFKYLKCVIDVIYNPLKTPLIIEAERLGIKAVGGLYMLVSQAVKAASIFLDKEFKNSKENIVYKNVLFKKRNLVLIGMPGSGKTTIGEEWAKFIKAKFLDIDTEIEKKIKMSIKDYILTNGENSFRKIESKTTKLLSNKNGYIISTGGGIVLNYENIINLKRNGVLVYLDRPFNKLEISDSRPLSSSKKKLKKMYRKRRRLYKKYADYIIKNDSNIKDIIQNLIFMLSVNY